MDDKTHIIAEWQGKVSPANQKCGAYNVRAFLIYFEIDRPPIIVSAGTTGPLKPAPIKSAGQYRSFRGPLGDDYCTPALDLK
jgi:hypothetical protein